MTKSYKIMTMSFILTLYLWSYIHSTGQTRIHENFSCLKWSHFFPAVSPLWYPIFCCPQSFSSRIIFQCSLTGESRSASSQHSSGSNCGASWRKQKIRHIKWQGIGLAGYFCILLTRERCIVYTSSFPIEQSSNRGKTDRITHSKSSVVNLLVCFIAIRKMMLSVSHTQKLIFKPYWKQQIHKYTTCLSYIVW